MWGAEHLHGDEGSWGQIPVAECFCAGCYEADEDIELVWNEPYCETCRLNMLCKACNEYDESVDRSKWQSVCETCRETK